MRKSNFSISILISSLLTGCATLGFDFDSQEYTYRENWQQYSPYESELSQGNPRLPRSQSYDSPESSGAYYHSSASDLYLGMRMDDVRQNWGEPRRVDTAGHWGSGNQRWVYSPPPSLRGFQSERVIYFEEGRVAGWETTD